jgi:hypothetical protein
LCKICGAKDIDKKVTVCHMEDFRIIDISVIISLISVLAQFSKYVTNYLKRPEAEFMNGQFC